MRFTTSRSWSGRALSNRHTLASFSLLKSLVTQPNWQRTMKAAAIGLVYRRATAIGVKGGGRLRKESGVTLLMVAVGMFALLSMAILSLGVVNVYMSSTQAQKTADAAALAGAEALASSGTTSNPASVPLNSVCNGSNGDADSRAASCCCPKHDCGTASNNGEYCVSREPTSLQSPNSGHHYADGNTYVLCADVGKHCDYRVRDSTRRGLQSIL
jgi:hypothetical protein